MVRALAALRCEAMPATPHALPLNPHIDWAALPVEVVAETRPWPRGARTRRMGVSSFGISGTNAHAIIEEAPAIEAAPVEPMPSTLPLVISGRATTAATGWPSHAGT